MGLEGDGVWVYRQVLGPVFPFFHEQVATTLSQLALGATQGGCHRFFIFFIYIMYLSLKYKKPHGALAMV